MTGGPPPADPRNGELVAELRRLSAKLDRILELLDPARRHPGNPPAGRAAG